jgi:hypothetical protein
MQTIDPNDLSNQQHTETLLEKSRALKERSKATNDNLNILKENADKLKQERINNEPVKK